MSSIKRQRTVLVVIVLLASTLFWVATLVAEEQENPVLDFYCGRAAEVNDAGDPIQHGLSFAYTAASFYQKLSSKGEVERVDSTIARRFYSFGILDSTLVEIKTTSELDDVSLVAPNVFRGPYSFHLFPNDTGGVGLAIGFDTDSLDDPSPVGLAVIDREKYLVRTLHLFYPDRKRHKRVSRSFRMAERDGYVFPDSVWEVGTKAGVFSVDVYRIETRISDLEIFR